MPRERDVLRKDVLPVIAPTVSRRQRALRDLPQIRTTARRHADIPHLIGTIGETRTDGGVSPLFLAVQPGLGPGRKRSELCLGRVPETPEPAGNGHAGRIARSPDNRHAYIFFGGG